MKINAKHHGIALKYEYGSGTCLPYIPTDLMNPAEFDCLPDNVKSDIASYNDAFQQVISDISPVPFDQFTRLGTTRYRTYPKFTYQGLIDIETRLSPWEYSSDNLPMLELDRIEIHGEAFRLHPIDVNKLLKSAWEHNFHEQRIDINFDISADFLPFETINHHFVNELLTANATRSPVTSNNKIGGTARTWYVGSNAANGYRISFYESGKIHEELPDSSWRIECQLYGNAASDYAIAYYNNPTPRTTTAYLLQLLKKRITFRTPGSDSNKSRWAVPSWWSQIIAGAGTFSENKRVTLPIREANRRKRLQSDLKRLLDRSGLLMFQEEFEIFKQQHIDPVFAEWGTPTCYTSIMPTSH